MQRILVTTRHNTHYQTAAGVVCMGYSIPGYLGANGQKGRENLKELVQRGIMVLLVPGGERGVGLPGPPDSRSPPGSRE